MKGLKEIVNESLDNSYEGRPIIPHWLRNVEQNTVIHCPTREEAKKVLKVFANHKFKWCNGKPYRMRDDKWDEYKSETCYCPHEGVMGRREYFENYHQNFHCYKIMSAQEFLKYNPE